MSGSFWVLPGAIASGVCVLGTFLRVCLLATFPALSGVSVSGYRPSGVSASFLGPSFRVSGVSGVPGVSGCFWVLPGAFGCVWVLPGAAACRFPPESANENN